MKNARTLIGLPVILGSRELGRVSAVAPEDDLRALRGIYFSCGFMGTRFVPRDKLDLIGDVAVLVHAPGRKSPPCAQSMPRRALSPDGKRLGAITDAIVDEETFAIPMLELSGGYFDDLTRGRERVGAFSVTQNGDVVIETSEGDNRT